MEDLKILLETLFSNCKSQNEVFKMQVDMVKEVKILKDKRLKEFTKEV